MTIPFATQTRLDDFLLLCNWNITSIVSQQKEVEELDFERLVWLTRLVVVGSSSRRSNVGKTEGKASEPVNRQYRHAQLPQSR
jgi:hypothetical protein